MKIKRAYSIEKVVSKLNIHAIDMLVWYALRYYLNKSLPRYYKKHNIGSGKKCSEYTDKEVIVSLTTFPKRMDTIWLVLESLFRQTVKPDRIILWLADEQYPEKTQVDSILKKYIDLGLEVEYCEDLRSHKKYFYAMKNYPEAIVVTVDDDILCAEDMLEQLLKTYQKYPEKIICHRAHLMLKNGDDLMPYNDWNYRAKGISESNIYLCPTGGAGVLYPPHCLSRHVFDKEVFTAICFYADDLWLKCMSYLNKTDIVLTGKDNPEIFDTIGTNESGLAQVNVVQGLNDKQISAVSEYYKIKW